MQEIDFIDVIDDIIDLSSDEETDRQDHITTQSQVSSHNNEEPGILADEELQDVFVEAAEGTQDATQSGNKVKATASSSVMENVVKATAAVPNCPLTTQTCPPTAGVFLSPTSTTPEALTFGGHDANLLRVKVRRPRKNYHTETPRRSPRLEDKYKGSSKSVKQILVYRRRSGILEPAEESAALANNAESSKALSTCPLGLQSLTGWGAFRGRRWKCSNKSVEESAASTSNENLRKSSLLAPQTKVVD